MFLQIISPVEEAMKRPSRKVVEIARGIVVDARVRFGQPTIKGTRVPVAVLLDELAAGSEIKEISKEYGVTPEDIRAAIRFVSQLLATEDRMVASR
jgi:uncharacterized protein (DUF433 family)